MSINMFVFLFEYIYYHRDKQHPPHVRSLCPHRLSLPAYERPGLVLRRRFFGGNTRAE